MTSMTQFAPSPLAFLRQLWQDHQVWLASALIVALLVVLNPPQAVESTTFALDAIFHTAPYLLLSIAIAAWAGATGADNLIAKAFTGAPLLMIVLGALAGGFSPFCSCGVIPLIAALLSMGVPKPFLWPAFALLVVLSVILIFASGPPAGPDGEILVSPFGLTISSALAGAASVFLVWKIGELFGGKGGFDETLLLTVFLQGMIFLGQLIELAIFFIIPPLADLYYFTLIVFMFWLNLNFIAVLHGFASLWRALGVLILASIGVFFVLVFAMSLAGVRLAGAP